MTLPDALADAVTDVRTRAIDRLAYAHDASHFVLTPQAVVVPRDAAEVGRLFAAAKRAGVPLTFRSGGTSLSGQAVTGGILVDTRRHFRRIEVLDDGARVRVGPGATVRQVNARLAAHGRKLGPDPASEAPARSAASSRTTRQRHGLRHRGQQLPHARVAHARAAVAARSSTPAPPTPTSGSRALEPELHAGPRPAARPAARRPRAPCARSSSSSR